MFTASEFRARAVQMIGLPYVLGAEWSSGTTAPKKPKALDCSELVEGLFRENGTPIGDLAAAQYDKTIAVTGAPKVGDLVFLRNNKHRWNGIGHVAVITAKLSNGDWEIVEARGRASGVVRTTLSYWKKRSYFTGVRRYPKFSLKVVETTSAPTTTELKKDTAFWVSTYNALDVRFGGKKNDDSSIIKTADSSVYLLTECNETQRSYLRASLPGGASRWKVWERGSQSVLFDSTKYTYSTSTQVVFGPTSYHGGVIAVLTRKDSGQKIQFGALHLPPKSVASDATRKKYFDKFVSKLDKDLPTVIGGDFNTVAVQEWAKSSGFVNSRTTSEKTVNGDMRTVDPFKKGSLVYDYLFGKNGIDWTDYAVIDAKGASDHNLVKSRAFIKGK